MPGLGILGLGLVFAACGPTSETTRVPVSASASIPGASKAPTRDETIDLERVINAHRASIGQGPIPRHPGLDQLARRHCGFMARNRGRFTLGPKNISHFGFEGRALVAKRRYGMDHCAENVAGGFIRGDVAAEVVRAWVESSLHEFNLRHRWDATGIGIFIADDGFVYATQIFGNRGPSGMGFSRRMEDF